MNSLRQFLKALPALAAAALLAGNLTACGEQKPVFSSIDITGADYGKAVALADHNGQVRHLSDFAGKVVVVFFGYTQCPDVCPTTLAELAEVKKLLGKDGDRVQGLFVTVDPERDTPELLKAYMANFDASFLALRPTPEELAAVAKDNGTPRRTAALGSDGSKSVTTRSGRSRSNSRSRRSTKFGSRAR